MQVTRRLNLFRPNVREEAVEAVSAVLRSGWIGLGPKTQQFEQAFGAYVGARSCVAVNSGTAALHLAVKLLDLPEGAEVITPAVTFISTNLAILQERLTPVFADIDPKTGNLTPAAIEARVTPHTGAIMIMHYAGYPCDLDEIYALAAAHHLPVVEDCAHATGASYKGRRIGSHDSLQAFSFDPSKNLTTGDGGALVSNTPEYEERLRCLRYLGMNKDSYRRFAQRSDSPRGWDYEVQEVGFRYHMNDIHAAIGLAQLPFLEEDNRRRAEIAALYRAGLAEVPGIGLLTRAEDRVCSNFLFCALAERRDDLLRKLSETGIGVSVHFKRNDEYPMFTRADDLPHTDWFCARAISLPMYPALQDEEVGSVIDLIREGW